MLGLNSPLKIFIFCGYIALWVASHVVVYSSRLAGAPPYNVTSVVLLTELTKLVLAIVMYVVRNGTLEQMLEAAMAHPHLLVKYFFPALLYCMYNNLVYVNLTVFDPGTYNVLMQLKIVLTGVIYQLVFSKQLNQNQWVAILLIAAGCMIKEMDKLSAGVAEGLAASSWGWLTLFFQMCCSCSAGVYNEALLKGESDPRVTTNLQNAFMYFQSIVCNVGMLIVQGKLGEALSPANFDAVFTPHVIAVIAIMSSVGLVTGFFLEHLDSVVKAVAGALEIVFTVLVSWILLAVPLTLSALVSSLVVFVGVALYSRPSVSAKFELLAASDDVELSTVAGKRSGE